jgi:hypothetical protein
VNSAKISKIISLWTIKFTPAATLFVFVKSLLPFYSTTFFMPYEERFLAINAVSEKKIENHHEIVK